MKTYTATFTGGDSVTFEIPGRYFRLISTTSPVTVEIFRDGKRLDETGTDVDGGYYAIPPEGFSKVTISSALGQTVKFGISAGVAGYDRAQGDVNATLVLATALTNVAPVTVGAAEVAALAAASSRKKVIFLAPLTNTADVALGATGLTLAQAAAVLSPGEVWEESDAPGAAWYAIAGAAGQKLNILTAA